MVNIAGEEEVGVVGCSVPTPMDDAASCSAPPVSPSNTVSMSCHISWKSEISELMVSDALWKTLRDEINSNSGHVWDTHTPC